MASEWNDKIQDAADKAEVELKRVIAYLNDEVVPEVRKHGSVALKAAAAELHKLAEKMDGK